MSRAAVQRARVLAEAVQLLLEPELEARKGQEEEGPPGPGPRPVDARWPLLLFEVGVSAV